MKKNRISIKWKIFIYLIGFCVLLLGILWLFQIVLLEQFYKNIKMSQVEKEAANIIQYVKDGDWDSVEQSASDRGDLYVEIWSPDRGILANTENSRENISMTLNDTDKKQLLDKVNNSNDHIIERYTDNNPFEPGPLKMQREGIIFAAALTDSTYGEILLMVNANITPVNSTVETLRIQLSYISVIMLVLSVILALLIAKRVANPIMQINESAMELGKGNYKTTFKGKGYREIMELSDTLTQAAGELGKTENLRRELIANVSHDLRTPLTLITGYSEMIRDLPDENTPENMQVIIDESKRLTVLVNDMLDLSKIQSGSLAMHAARFNLTEAVRDIINRISRLCEQDAYDISFEYSEEAYVCADSDRMSQVIYNLLINAMNYTGEDKKVIVRQIVRSDRALIQIIDTGKGIPKEELPHVWDRYYRVETNKKQTGNKPVAGTGLGLSIAKSVLDQHPDIQYGVISEEGQGCNFWFSIPLSDEEELE